MVKGELLLGQSVAVGCFVNLSPSVVKSIKLMKGNVQLNENNSVWYEIKELKFWNNNEIITCKVSYGFNNELLTKSYLLQIKDIKSIIIN